MGRAINWWVEWIAVLLVLGIASTTAGAPHRPRKQIILVVGLPGSGKSVVTRHLGRLLRARRHISGNLIREWVKQQGLPYTPANDRLGSKHFAKTPGLIGEKIAAKVHRSRKQVHIVDGIRSPSDAKVLRRYFDVRVVALSLPAKVRHRRMLARGRFTRADKSYLRKRDRREVSLGLLHLLRRPFVRLDMRGSLESTVEQVEDLARSLFRGVR